LIFSQPWGIILMVAWGCQAFSWSSSTIPGAWLRFPDGLWDMGFMKWKGIGLRGHGIWGIPFMFMRGFPHVDGLRWIAHIHHHVKDQTRRENSTRVVIPTVK
jgi:hypothetical protein